METLGHSLKEVMAIRPDAPAIEQDETWWTWQDLHTVHLALAKCFDEARIPKGGRIGILLRNRASHAAATAACVIEQRCIVAFNPLLSPDRLSADLRAQNVAMLLGSRPDLSRTEVSTVMAELECPTLCLPDTTSEPANWFGDVRVARASALSQLHPKILVELLTSGTTGTPKRVPLKRVSFDEGLSAANAYESARSSDQKPTLRSGVRIVTAPLTHISGLSALLMSMAGGRKVALLEKFNVETWVKAVERHQAKVVNIPPAALRMILTANVASQSLSSLVAVRAGTAPLDPAIADAFMTRYRLPILQQYGATEFAGGVAGWTMSDFRRFYKEKPGSVGRIQSNIQARIVDPETGQSLRSGSKGLLELRGRQLGDPDVWVRTTDRASLDDEGFLWIHGRADNAINRGGFKIHPDEIARVLEKHPAIREAVVVGIPDHRLGEVPCAAVIAEPDREIPSEADLIAYLREQLLPYQIPSQIKFVRDLPRATMMKPSTAEVKRLFEASVPR